MEPRIQYAQTEDGASIAFWTLGEGEALFHVPLAPLTHTQMSWQIPEYRRWLEGLAQKRMLVFWDWRGCGLSDRLAGDVSMDAFILDLEAVARSVGADRFALFAMFSSAPVALTYAARHPQRVSHVVLWHGIAGFLEQADSSVAAGRVGKVDQDVWAQMVAPIVVGQEAPGELMRQVRALLREAVEGTALALLLDQSMWLDATALLPQVSTPTLILHRRKQPMVSLDVARGLATRIVGSQLVVLEGDAFAPFAGDSEAALSAIDEFLSGGEEAPPAPELPEGMAVLLFADIAESTALTEQLGDAAFRAKARQLDTSLRSVIREAGGTPVEGKVLGDGVLAVFTSARQAIDCALRCEATGEPLGLRLHLGIHAGDVIREGNNVYGGAVNIAARIAAAAEPGEVLVSDTVRSLGRTSADVTFDDRGEHTLKGVGDPQRLFAVRGGG